MSATLLAASTILGGAALFLFGMRLMSDGLRQSAGERLRAILDRATSNRAVGFGLGTMLGFLALSGPSIIMVLSFLNAGLMKLVQSVPVILGANLGTTLTLQLISFRLNKYCYALVALGFGLSLLPSERQRHFGRAVLGYGMLFLGITTLGNAIEPYREQLAGMLVRLYGETLWETLVAVLLATLLTAAVQSSGAVVGMCFVLASTGVITRLDQVFPIVLGAHIGTVTPALLFSLGANLDVRRAASSDLVFNVTGTVLMLLIAPWVLNIVRMTTADLVHQTANLHTLTIAIPALLVLPFSRTYARLLEFLVRAKGAQPASSFLESNLLAYPEQALVAGIRELQRVACLCSRNFRLSMDLIFEPDERKYRTVKLNEQAINEIKQSMKTYLHRLARSALSRRQAMLAQHLNRCMADIERIGDHIDAIADTAKRQHQLQAARFGRNTLDLLVDLYGAADKVLRLVIESLNPDLQEFQGLAQAILEGRNAYMEESRHAKGLFLEQIASHEVPAIAGIYFSEYIASLDRIVRHAKLVALAEKQPDFWVKRVRLDRRAVESSGTPPPPVSAKDFLARLNLENDL